MRQSLPEPLKDAARGLLTTLADVVLFTAALPVGLLFTERTARGISESFSWAAGVNVKSIRRAISHARARGWIKYDLTVSRAGQKRLRGLLPARRPYPKKWNGVWHLVSFDIPEKISKKRDALRSGLKRLGFAPLHQSHWISPFDYLGDVKSDIRSLHLTPFVVFSRSNEVGQEEPPLLAARLWRTEEVDYRYLKFIGSVNAGKASLQELLLEYYSVLHDDPFLPRPLLPEHWFGDEAHGVAAALLSRAKRS